MCQFIFNLIYIQFELFGKVMFFFAASKILEKSTFDRFVKSFRFLKFSSSVPVNGIYSHFQVDVENRCIKHALINISSI